MIRKFLSLFFLLAWGALALLGLLLSFSASLRSYPYLWGVPVEEKNRRLDQELYAVAKVCERRIPSTEALFLINSVSPEQKAHPMHTANFFLMHDRQKLSYFLYPRRVYWNEKNVREPIRYVLVYYAKVEISGFEHLIDFSDSISLLKRKGPQ